MGLRGTSTEGQMIYGAFTSVCVLFFNDVELRLLFVVNSYRAEDGASFVYFTYLCYFLCLVFFLKGSFHFLILV